MSRSLQENMVAEVMRRAFAFADKAEGTRESADIDRICEAGRGSPAVYDEARRRIQKQRVASRSTDYYDDATAAVEAAAVRAGFALAWEASTGFIIKKSERS